MTGSTECSFTNEKIQRDDSTRKRFLELPEEEKQSSFVALIQLLPGTDRLEIEEMEGQLAWRHSKLSVEDFSILEALGLRGKLIASGYCCLGHEPFNSRTLIVAQHQIGKPEDLPQPNNCKMIYYQVGDEWRKFPEEAPVLKKRIRLSLDPTNQALFHFRVEDYFASDTGGGGGLFNWANWGRW